jgi:hypothetical protein
MVYHPGCKRRLALFCQRSVLEFRRGLQETNCIESRCLGCALKVWRLLTVERGSLSTSFPLPIIADGVVQALDPKRELTALSAARLVL